MRIKFVASNKGRGRRGKRRREKGSQVFHPGELVFVSKRGVIPQLTTGSIYSSRRIRFVHRKYCAHRMHKPRRARLLLGAK